MRFFLRQQGFGRVLRESPSGKPFSVYFSEEKGLFKALKPLDGETLTYREVAEKLMSKADEYVKTHLEEVIERVEKKASLAKR